MTIDTKKRNYRIDTMKFLSIIYSISEGAKIYMLF